jgi:hypothetical protein
VPPGDEHSSLFQGEMLQSQPQAGSNTIIYRIPSTSTEGRNQGTQLRGAAGVLGDGCAAAVRPRRPCPAPTHQTRK